MIRLFKYNIKNTRCGWHKTVLVLGLFFLFSAAVNGKNDLKSLSDYLDHIINNKDQFSEKKEQEIANLRNLLKKNEPSSEYNYEINRKLYYQYKKYKLDSAIYYASENVRIAKELNNQHLIYIANIELASAYSYSGGFLESGKILNSINSEKLSKELQIMYYDAYFRFYEHYAVISNQRKYYEQVEIYRDSLLSVLDSSSFQYKINRVHRYMQANQTKEAEKQLLDLLANEDTETPEYAMITSFLGLISEKKGEPELELKYYTMSAIADIKNAIKENTSFLRLARIYYQNGNISKAFQFSQSAIEDAVFSSIQFRTAQMAEFYSIINASYQIKETKTNKELKRDLLLISILSLFLILLVLFIYKQMKKLSHIKEELSQTNYQLIELNKELKEKNDLLNDKNTALWDSNHIKEQYIAQFFNLCSTYIDKIEDYRRDLFKLGSGRQYEELMKRLKSTTMIENELDELYKHFDSIFLNLYPTFVQDFNSLLIEEERIALKADDLLNKELRIYALLRLGITDSTKIASFLRCSMSTVYNYRTKMRNKALVSRNDFENRVMKIGIIHTNSN